MIVPYGWRITWQDQVYGPRDFVQHLYEAARYMPPEAMWEYCDSSGDWFTHISVGQWREYVSLVRDLWYHDDGERAAPIDDCSLWYTYHDLYKKLYIRRAHLKHRLAGLRNWQKTRVIYPWEWWQKENPGWEKRVAAKLEKTRARHAIEIAEIEKELGL